MPIIRPAYAVSCLAAIFVVCLAAAPTNAPPKVDMPTPSAELDARNRSLMPGKTNAPAAQTNAPAPSGPLDLESAKVPPGPRLPTFADGVRWGATAARRNPDVWDAMMLIQIAHGLFIQDEQNLQQQQQQARQNPQGKP